MKQGHHWDLPDRGYSEARLFTETLLWPSRHADTHQSHQEAPLQKIKQFCPGYEDASVQEKRNLVGTEHCP